MPSHPPAPRISVLLRVRDEIAVLPLFWESLERQTVFDRTEVIVLDSGSTDGTKEFLLEKNCALHSIEPHDFNFGRSCNQIAAFAASPVLVFLSGHVILKQDDALEKVAGLLESQPHAAAYLRQVPNTILGYNAYEAAYLKRRFPAGDDPVQSSAPGAFSNAASAITRFAWLSQPFQEVHGSEDFLWAQQHLKSGGTLFYLPQIEVMHSHNETAEQVYRRVRINAETRGQTRAYAKSAYLLTGVYTSMRRVGASHAEALKYAAAHAKAYW